MMDRAAYRIKEVAEKLGIGESSVYRLIHSGDLACYRVARNTVRVGVHHLAAYLERIECPAQKLTENGSSSNDEGAPNGTPIAESTVSLNGFRSKLRMRAKLARISRTSKPIPNIAKS